MNFNPNQMHLLFMIVPNSQGFNFNHKNNLNRCTLMTGYEQTFFIIIPFNNSLLIYWELLLYMLINTCIFVSSSLCKCSYDHRIPDWENLGYTLNDKELFLQFCLCNHRVSYLEIQFLLSILEEWLFKWSNKFLI